MTIRIKEQDLTARYTLKAQMLWEQANDKPFAPSNTMEVWIYYYCILLACNPEMDLTLEELIKEASEDEGIGKRLFEVAMPPSFLSKKKAKETKSPSAWRRFLRFLRLD